MLRTRIFRVLGLAAAALTFGASSASAVTFPLTLNTPNSQLSGTTGPYATVDATQINSTTVEFTFTPTAGYGFVDGGSIGLNINCPLADISVDNIQVNGVSSSLFTVSISTGGQNNLDGFGNFNVNLNQQDSSNPVTDPVTFDVHCSDGLTVATSLIANDKGELAGAHIFSSAANLTGFVANGPAAVPEPSTMAIAGLGALGFVGFGLRRRLKK
jgi:hypothetical protein